MAPNPYDTTKGQYADGRNKSYSKGTCKPRGKPFQKKGVDPEMDEIRAKAGQDNSAKGVEERRKMSNYKRTDYWEAQMSEYLNQDGHGNAGVDILNEIDAIIQRTESDNTKKELLKLKVSMLGLTAPAAPVESVVETQEQESIDEIKAKLAMLGILDEEAESEDEATDETKA